MKRGCAFKYICNNACKVNYETDILCGDCIHYRMIDSGYGNCIHDAPIYNKKRKRMEFKEVAWCFSGCNSWEKKQRRIK